MNYEKTIFSLTSIFLTPLILFSQVPDEVDPGNARGDEGTVDLWEQPEVYVPVLVIVVLLITFSWLRRKNRSKRR